MTLTYSLSGTDASLFMIDSSTGEVSFINAPDFESPDDAGRDNVYDIIVTASDGTNSTDQSVAITVTDVNEAPIVIELSDLTSDQGFVINASRQILEFTIESLSSSGDVNGDGYDDLIIGADGYFNDVGEAYIVFGGPSGTESVNLASFTSAQGFIIQLSLIHI